MSLASTAMSAVLHFTPSLGGGGAEVMLSNLVQAMRGGSWRQIVVAVRTGTTGCQAAKMREQADAFYDLNSMSMMRPRMWLDLFRIIRKERPDVVQTWMHHQDFFGGVIARLAGVKHVVWGIHTPYIFRWPGDSDLKFSLFQSAIRAASRAVPEKIISCSEDAIEFHQGLGYPRSKMAKIINGVCTERFRPDAEAGAATRNVLDIPLDAPVIGFVGRFHPVKDLANFFQAADLLWQRMPRAHFIMSGGTADQLYPEARSAFEKISRKDQVRFLPFNDSPQKLYPALSVFSLGSSSEALPMALIEAMACGIPCVTTDTGDCALLVGDAGLIVPARDPASLADAWEKMLAADVAGRIALSQRARERAVREFGIDRAAERYGDAWLSTLPA